MACRGFWECLLKLLNFMLTITGLSMVGYGIYLLVEWMRIAPEDDDGSGSISPSAYDEGFWKIGRPMFVAVSFFDGFLDKLPKAWFIYLFIGIGVIVFIISCFGCIGAVLRNACCLSCYSSLVILLILLELGAAAFIFFDHNWKDVLPIDKTGNFDKLYDFLKDNWNIAKWVALGVVILETLVFLLALILRALYKPAEYDSDDEYIVPRSGVRQPLISRQAAPATGAPAVPSLDQRPIRNDTWSQRMREKYGLDASDFSYNPSDPGRVQGATPPAEEKGRCTIL